MDQISFISYAVPN